MKNGKTPEITKALVEKLVLNQFPKWSHLQILPVKSMGWDNRTFRLGDMMSVRLPSSEEYAPQILKEHKWLPVIGPKLSIAIPCEHALGQPSNDFPWHWSIRNWINGESANNEKGIDRRELAAPVAEFLNELHSIDGGDGPQPGPHSFNRGGSLAAYDNDAQKAFLGLRDLIDVDAARIIWEAALKYKYQGPSVWVHGDMGSGNIIVKNGKLSAIIDFGIVSVGDPSCDLVMAWTYFEGSSRQIFKEVLSRDATMWARARGWALYKVLNQLGINRDQQTTVSIEQYKKLFNRILED